MREKKKLSPEEAVAFADLINNYLAKETMDYNTHRRILAEQGDIFGVIRVVDEYVEYLKLLEDLLENALIGLRKTNLTLTENSDYFKRKYLERIYENKEQ